VTKEIKSMRGSWKVIDSGTIQFDIRDEKGRRVGYWWQIAELEMLPYDKSKANYGGYYQEPGIYIEVSAQATRNDEPYGASNRAKEFKTIAEAKAEIERQAAACEKRYAKKYGT